MSSNMQEKENAIIQGITAAGFVRNVSSALITIARKEMQILLEMIEQSRNLMKTTEQIVNHLISKLPEKKLKIPEQQELNQFKISMFNKLKKFETA